MDQKFGRETCPPGPDGGCAYAYNSVAVANQYSKAKFYGAMSQGRSQKKNSGGGYGAEGARIEAYKMFHANLFHKKKNFAKISGGGGF
jgi:hypothetical protein